MTIQRFEFPSALSKMFIGLNLLNDELSDYTPNDNYPPFNIIQNDPDHTTIEMALAGFSPEEIEVTTKNSMLNISTTVEKDDKNFGRVLLWLVRKFGVPEGIFAPGTTNPPCLAPR